MKPDFKNIEFENTDETDREDYVPNFQVLCYPVISLFGKALTHKDIIKSIKCLNKKGLTNDYRRRTTSKKEKINA